MTALEPLGYDALNRQTSGFGNTYAYDKLDRLTSAPEKKTAG